MGTYNWQSAMTINNGDIAYRAWGKGLHDAFLNAGLVQASDTGQVDWALAGMGAATSGIIWHYEVFRFADSFQSTVPIFI